MSVSNRFHYLVSPGIPPGLFLSLKGATNERTNQPRNGNARENVSYGWDMEPLFSSPTPIEVVSSFAEYLKSRADAGVLLAQSVTGVDYSDRTVTITFSAPSVLLDLNPYRNLAQFPGTVIAFKNEQGNYLRPAIDAVVTVDAKGEPLGTLTTEEIYKMGTGEELN